MRLILFLHGIRGEALWELGSLRLKNNLVKRFRELGIKGIKAPLRGIVVRGLRWLNLRIMKLALVPRKALAPLSFQEE